MTQETHALGESVENASLKTKITANMIPFFAADLCTEERAGYATLTFVREAGTVHRGERGSPSSYSWSVGAYPNKSTSNQSSTGSGGRQNCSSTSGTVAVGGSGSATDGDGDAAVALSVGTLRRS